MYLLLASSPRADPLTRPPEFSSYTRPILPLRVSSGLFFSLSDETGEIFRLPNREKRDSTGDTLICPPRIKRQLAKYCLSHLKLGFSSSREIRCNAREILISQPERYGARERKPSALRPWADTKREMCLQKNLLASEDASTRRNTRKLKARGHHIAKDVYPFVQSFPYFPPTPRRDPAYFSSLNLNFFNLSLGISSIYNLIMCYNYVGTSMTWICNTVDFIWTLAKSASSCNLLMLAHAWS